MSTPSAIDLPIIASGCRTNQETEGAVDVELANALVLCPVDLLEFRCLCHSLLPILLGMGSDICCLETDHVCSGQAEL